VKILVTGGAGYVGSQLMLHLKDCGHDIAVLDDLSSGHSWEFLRGALIEGDVRDLGTVVEAIRLIQAEAVVHLAGVSNLRESVINPSKHFRTNVLGTLNVAEACASCSVRYLVFSSSAAVYGAPSTIPISEDSPIAPINPYGVSKAMAETVLREIGATASFRFVALRYFNVAGADSEARVGEAMPGAWHLIKVACEAAVGLRDEVKIFGTDFETPDGTCVRDFVHVEDVASAHLSALNYLASGGESCAMNVGYGRGVSVREVVNTVRRYAHGSFRVVEASRRPGDPPTLVADSTKLKTRCGWVPKYESLEAIIGSALAWEERQTGTGANNNVGGA